MTGEDKRRKAALREMLRRQSCQQMRLMDEERALAGGTGDLRSRIPEPEVMDQEEMLAFMRNNRPIRDNNQGEVIKPFLHLCPSFSMEGTLLDLGCATGELSIYMSLVFPRLSITAVDASPGCIEEAQKLANHFNLANPPEFIRAHLPDDKLSSRKFDTVFSRSTLHHFQRGGDFWKVVKRHGKSGGTVYAYDLARPITRRGAELLVDGALMPNAPEVNRRIYMRSFMAAYRPAEVRLDLEACGLRGLRVEPLQPSLSLIHI